MKTMLYKAAGIAILVAGTTSAAHAQYYSYQPAYPAPAYGCGGWGQPACAPNNAAAGALTGAATGAAIGAIAGGGKGAAIGAGAGAALGAAAGSTQPAYGYGYPAPAPAYGYAPSYGYGGYPYR